MPSLPIRPASRDDLPACARLMASSEPWLTLGRTIEASLAILQNPRKEVYVASSGSELLGFLILDLSGPLPGYIQTVCVDHGARGRGLGTTLIAFAEQRILRESPNVFMCVSSFNPDALRLYQRLGYEVVGVLRGYLVPEHDEILLRKTVGPWSRHASPIPPPGNPRGAA